MERVSDKPNTVEFYDNALDRGKDKIAVVQSFSVPGVDEFISIRGKTYRVTRRTWALDHSDKRTERALRACVELDVSS